MSVVQTARDALPYTVYIHWCAEGGGRRVVGTLRLTRARGVHCHRPYCARWWLGSAWRGAVVGTDTSALGDQSVHVL
jgi:hypothetical protein